MKDLHHATATCERKSCPLCANYWEGYDIGQSAAYAEFFSALEDDHDSGCTCEPCNLFTEIGRRPPADSLDSMPAPDRIVHLDQLCTSCRHTLVTYEIDPTRSRATFTASTDSRVGSLSRGGRTTLPTAARDGANACGEAKFVSQTCIPQALRGGQ